MLTFGSLFAGIGGFDLGFERAGMRGVWQVEIDAKCRELLAQRFPTAVQYDNVQTVGSHNLKPVDVVCGGFPCQDLSVAGKRAGLAGARSGLFFEMTRIADELKPSLLVWENVPGLLSSNSGKDFLIVLMELERIGYHGCWTTLDARWFGVAQRRRRVFGVFARGDIGAARAAEILSLAARMSGHFEPSREAGRVSPPLTATGVGAGRTGNERNELDFCVPTMRANGDAHSGFVDHYGVVPAVAGAITTREGMRQKVDQDTFLVSTVDDGRADRPNGGMYINKVGVGNGISSKSKTLVAWHENKSGSFTPDTVAKALRSSASHSYQGVGVRRLTPTECERLQGFPDGWTDGFADSTRYKMLGNAVAVPCSQWIGRRIVEMENA